MESKYIYILLFTFFDLFFFFPFFFSPKEKYRRKQEALVQQEAASNSKIDEIRQKYEEDIIFKVLFF